MSTRDINLLVRAADGRLFQLEGQLDLGPERAESTSPPPLELIGLMLGRLPIRVRKWLIERVIEHYADFADGGPPPRTPEADVARARALVKTISRRASAAAGPIVGTLAETEISDPIIRAFHGRHCNDRQCDRQGRHAESA